MRTALKLVALAAIVVATTSAPVAAPASAPRSTASVSCLALRMGRASGGTSSSASGGIGSAEMSADATATFFPPAASRMADASGPSFAGAFER